MRKLNVRTARAAFEVLKLKQGIATIIETSGGLPAHHADYLAGKIVESIRRRGWCKVYRRNEK